LTATGEKSFGVSSLAGGERKCMGLLVDLVNEGKSRRSGWSGVRGKNKTGSRVA
jgi:hypothetical protein